jgi:hypothetical protein
LENGGDIDFNAIGYDLIELDKEIAGKFHSKSLISAGIQFFVFIKFYQINFQ